MSILTPETCKEVWLTCESIEDEKFWPELASKLETAVIKRLAAVVSVEPYATLHHDDGYFTTKQREHDLRYSGPMRTEVVTLDQLNTALAAARVQMNDACAKVCARYRDLPAGYSETKIRALLGKEQS